MHRHLLRSVLGVTIFWWVLLTAWSMRQSERLAWEASARLLSTCCLGLFLGAASVVVYTIIHRRTTQLFLSGDAVRGLRCTIGEMPLIAREPKRNKRPVKVTTPDVPESFIEDWRSKYAGYPEHIALFDALLHIHDINRTLPATHVPGGHGGRSLFQHSILVAWQMEVLGQQWTYSGLRDKTGKRIQLKLRDQSYVFDPTDPMLAIIGLAHDMGKIESFVFEKGRAGDPKAIIGTHHEHDLIGGRLIGRIPEAWRIPSADRETLLLAVAHYHHPMALPLAPDHRAIDDRTIALMELLIKADFVASRIESEHRTPSEEEYISSDVSDEVPITSEMLWNGFIDVVSEHGRINGSDKRYNLGVYCEAEGFPKPMLFLREDAVRLALSQRLHQRAEPIGDGRYPLTIKFLTCLAEKGILTTEALGMRYKPESALWNIDFFGRPKPGVPPRRFTGWSAVMIVDPDTLLPQIAKAGVYRWFAIIQRPTMGAARQSKPSSVASAMSSLPAASSESPGAAQADSAKASLGPTDRLAESVLQGLPPDRAPAPCAPPPAPVLTLQEILREMGEQTEEPPQDSPPLQPETLGSTASPSGVPGLSSADASAARASIERLVATIASRAAEQGIELQTKNGYVCESLLYIASLFPDIGADSLLSDIPRLFSEDDAPLRLIEHAGSRFIAYRPKAFASSSGLSRSSCPLVTS